MIIIRDRDTEQERAAQIMEQLSINVDSMAVLDEQYDPLSETSDDCVLFLTTMPAGCLGYQRTFFDAHRHSIPLWGVLLLNDSAVVYNHLDAFFGSNGLRRRVFRVTADTDFETLSKELTKLTSIHPRRVLLYSVRPHCGKRSLAQLLSEDLPTWEFRTMEENPPHSGLPSTDAGQILIMGQTLSELCAVRLPAGVEPFYVLTMPDMYVQAYLNREQLPGRLLEHDGPPVSWTEANAQRHLFYVSPLYESWYRTNTNPVLDERFVMWDRFGLPCPRRDYTEEKIQEFLSQFQQCRNLANALQNTL